MNAPIYMNRDNYIEILSKIKVGDWYQLYFDEANPEKSDTQAFFNGDFWIDGEEEDPNSFCCHAHTPFKLIKLYPMNIYSISYDHIGGSINLQTNSILALSQKLDAAIDDPYVNNESIKITTEVTK